MLTRCSPLDIDNNEDGDAAAVKSDWRKDAGEKARRIWYWWTPIVAQGAIARDFP